MDSGAPQLELQKVRLDIGQGTRTSGSFAPGDRTPAADNPRDREAAFIRDIRTGNPGLVHWVGGLALPLIAPVMLLFCTVAWSQSLGSAYVVLAVLSFFVLYPGRWAATRSAIDFGKQVLTPWAGVIAVLGVIALLTGGFHGIHHGVFLTWLVLTPIAQGTALRYLPQTLARLVSLRRDKHHIVVVGANAAGRSFAHAVTADAIAHSRVVAFFDDRDPGRLEPDLGAPLAGRVQDIGEYVRHNRVDQIYIALPVSSQPRITALLQQLQDSTASVYFVPDIMSIDLIQPRMDTHAGFPVVGVCESPFQGFNAIVKRTSDIILALIAIILVLPVMIAVALAVRLSSPGPIIFKQRRFGLDGSEISVWKFRSMSVTEDGSKIYRQVERGDPRVTKVGGFIRKTSLDELPQFFNVLQGKMSIVGPRPHAMRVNDHYRRLIPGYMVRHKVRPGITGWAQVNGYRGGDDLVSMTKRIEHDLEYLRNWSVWLDLKILVRTVLLVVRDSTAY